MGNTELNMNMFIIPNKAGFTKDFIFGADAKTEQAKELCQINGATFDPEKDKVVQVWSCCDGCDNMQDHTFKIGEATFRLPVVIPEPILRGKKEGDIADIKFQLVPLGGGDEVQITCHTRLAQAEYRYRQFGNFEDALQYVL